MSRSPQKFQELNPNQNHHFLLKVNSKRHNKTSNASSRKKKTKGTSKTEIIYTFAGTNVTGHATTLGKKKSLTNINTKLSQESRISIEIAQAIKLIIDGFLKGIAAGRRRVSWVDKVSTTDQFGSARRRIRLPFNQTGCDANHYNYCYYRCWYSGRNHGWFSSLFSFFFFLSLCSGPLMCWSEEGARNVFHLPLQLPTFIVSGELTFIISIL